MRNVHQIRAKPSQLHYLPDQPILKSVNLRREIEKRSIEALKVFVLKAMATARGDERPCSVICYITPSDHADHCSPGLIAREVEMIIQRNSAEDERWFIDVGINSIHVWRTW